MAAHAHHWLKYPHCFWISTGCQPASAKHSLGSSNLSPFVQLEIPYSNYYLLKKKVNLPCSFFLPLLLLEKRKIQLRENKTEGTCTPAVSPA